MEYYSRQSNGLACEYILYTSSGTVSTLYSLANLVYCLEPREEFVQHCLEVEVDVCCVEVLVEVGPAARAAVHLSLQYSCTFIEIKTKRSILNWCHSVEQVYMD